MTARVRWNFDLGAERAVRRLRIAAACVAALAAGWIVALGPTLFGWVVALLSALAAVGYFANARRARARIERAEERYLELDSEGLHVCEGREQTHVAWVDVAFSEVDEDRLVLVIGRRNAPPLSIAPIYENAGLYELRGAVEHYRAESASRIGSWTGVPESPMHDKPARED